MEEQRTGSGVKASTFFMTGHLWADPMQCWASLECYGSVLQHIHNPNGDLSYKRQTWKPIDNLPLTIHMYTIAVYDYWFSVSFFCMFYGMFYGTVYDYNSYTHIIPTTPRYNQYQASFSPFRVLLEKNRPGNEASICHVTTMCTSVNWKPLISIGGFGALWI